MGDDTADLLAWALAGFITMCLAAVIGFAIAGKLPSQQPDRWTPATDGQPTIFTPRVVP